MESRRSVHVPLLCIRFTCSRLLAHMGSERLLGWVANGYERQLVTRKHSQFRVNDKAQCYEMDIPANIGELRHTKHAKRWQRKRNTRDRHTYKHTQHTDKTTQTNGA